RPLKRLGKCPCSLGCVGREHGSSWGPDSRLPKQALRPFLVVCSAPADRACSVRHSLVECHPAFSIRNNGQFRGQSIDFEISCICSLPDQAHLRGVIPLEGTSPT